MLCARSRPAVQQLRRRSVAAQCSAAGCAATALRLAWPRVRREPLEAGHRLASSPRHSPIATGRRVPRVADRRAPRSRADCQTDRDEGLKSQEWVSVSSR